MYTGRGPGVVYIAVAGVMDAIRGQPTEIHPSVLSEREL